MVLFIGQKEKMCFLSQHDHKILTKYIDTVASPVELFSQHWYKKWHDILCWHCSVVSRSHICSWPYNIQFVSQVMLFFYKAHSLYMVLLRKRKIQTYS